MKNLNRQDYCLSCEHVLEEQGYTFDNSLPFVAVPTSLENLYCKKCNQPIEPKLELVNNDYNRFLTALKNSKLKVVAFVAPSVRAGIGECFGLNLDCEHKIVTALKQLGCYSVYSMNFGADLTIMEESTELMQRLKTKQSLPLLTSCCPAWVNYIYKLYPTLKANLSTCKSPQQMMGAVINNYYTKVNNLQSTDIFVVSVVPCLAKKLERVRTNINSNVGYDVDACITTTELAKIIKSNNIDFVNLPNTPFDSLFKEYSGSASAFGKAGGVSEAIIYNIDKNAQLLTTKIENITTKTFLVNGKTLKIAQIQGLNNAKQILQSIIDGNCLYHMVEVMACTGGCIGGAGMPYNENLANREQILQNSKNNASICQAKDNPIVQTLYKDYLTPTIAYNLLHEKRD